MKYRIGPVFLWIFIGVFLGGGWLPIAAEAGKQVLILDIPRFDLSDISEGYPNLLKLVEGSTVGIVTTPLADPLTLDRIYLSFNSGNQIKTPPEGYSIYNVGEEVNQQRAGDLYRNLTGVKAPADGAVYLELAKVMQLNDQIGNETLGLFGKLLHKKGFQTAAIGNADSDIKNRYAATAMLDQNGIIDRGAVGPETVMNDPLFPGGKRTDPSQILRYRQIFTNKAQVTIITLGDLERIERYGVYLSKNRWIFLRREALRNYDRLVGKLISEMDFRTTLLVLFTALPPGTDQTPGSRLTPVLMKGPGFGKGLLYSRSTRKTGILTGYDLPVTILNFLDINTRGFYHGYRLTVKPGQWQTMIGQQAGLIKNYDFRWPLLTGYGYLLIGLFLLMMLGLILGFGSRLIRRLEWVYLFLITFPAVFLIEALINPLDWVSVAGWTLGLAGLLLGAAFLISKRDLFGTFSVISIITVGLILMDILGNGYCELRSFLGYSAVAGARFYGIGNEYLGLLLGAYIAAVSVNDHRARTWQSNRFNAKILWLGVILITVLIIHPNLGAKIGGGITALTGLGVTTYIWLERPIRGKEIIGLLGALMVMLILTGIWDFYINRNSITHFGQLVSFVKQGGFKTIIALISRKFQLNLRLIDYSAWTRVLIGVLLAIPLFYKKPPIKLAGLFQKYPGITKGFLGLNITAIIGLLVNDSGIVTAATMFIFGAFMLLMTVIEEWTGQKVSVG
jgi:hypothetical protein